MPRARTPSGGRLSVDAWIHEGFTIIAEEGLNELKVDRLCERLGVTKGSFSWHFVDVPSYRASLVSSWAEMRDADHREFDQLSGVPPALLGAHPWTMERDARLGTVSGRGGQKTTWAARRHQP
jgi:hypothetical protein